MLLAKELARSLLSVAGGNLKAAGVLDIDFLVNHGFPGKLSVDGADLTGKTGCVRIDSGSRNGGFQSDLLAAFEDYEQFSASREMPSCGEILSPVLPVDQPLAPFRIASYPEERYLFAWGNLPLPCPTCGRMVHAMGRGPVSSMAEYFEYECCHPFYYFRPFREWAFDKAVYVPAANTLYHYGHRHARREFLVRMFEDFRRNLDACLREILKGEEIKQQQLPNGTIPILFGRGEFNPGHIIFEDLAGAFLLCEAMEASGAPGRLEVFVCENAKWYAPLLEVLPGHRVARVTPVPSDMAGISFWLCRKGLPLVNPTVHPCWPHTFDACKYLERMCERIVALADQKKHDVDKNVMRVVFPMRTHNRRWEPLFENVLGTIAYLKEHYSPVHFVLHAVGIGGRDVELFRGLAAQRRDVELLFDAPLLDVLAQYGTADLCVGPIGSGFWWAGLFGVPSVTIHPENNPYTVEQGAWMLPPPKGSCPHFLALNPDQRCVVVEEKNSRRKTYGSLSPPLGNVLRAIDQILYPGLKRKLPAQSTIGDASGGEKTRLRR